MKTNRFLPLRTLLRAALLLTVAGAATLRAETYTLFIYETATDLAARTDEKRGPAYWEAFAAYGNQLKEAGVLRGGSALQAGEQAIVVERSEGRRTLMKGAYAKTPTQLGGYFIIDVANLDAAIEWAGRAPNAGTGAVEVRPAFPSPGM